MKKLQNNYIYVFLIILIVISAVFFGYYSLFNKNPEQNINISAGQQTFVSDEKNPNLSLDRKSIGEGGSILLAIDNNTIFNWFKTKSQLCDEYNITSVVGRKSFCENIESFKSQTRFASIVVSPDKMKIGFTIESDTLSPDSVVGILSRSNNTINLIGNYYLGSEFISFSPNGVNFAYKGDCFEGMCELYIKNSETLDTVSRLSDSDSADARTRVISFKRWISDNEVEYKLGEESKIASF